jgi:rod shape determining protein RodA
MFERRLYYHIDWAMLAGMLALCAIGLAQIFSATGGFTASTTRRSTGSSSAGRDGVCLSDRLPVAGGQVALDLPRACSCCSLRAVLRRVRGGSRRWIDLGRSTCSRPSSPRPRSRSCSPSSSARAARTRSREDLRSRAHHARPLFSSRGSRISGTAVTLIPIGFAVAYRRPACRCASSASWRSRAARRAVAWKFALQDYQRERISTFLDPAQDAKGAGYQQIQARITVGSGGLMGKGFTKGTQGQLRFLPVAHNDFIFSVLAEEQGFAGVLVTLGLYLFVILRALESARLAKDRLGRVPGAGGAASFTFQVIYNVTMSAGLAPVKGLTLPLMSYGGSSMIATLAAFGLILNVRMRRFTN